MSNAQLQALLFSVLVLFAPAVVRAQTAPQAAQCCIMEADRSAPQIPDSFWTTALKGALYITNPTLGAAAAYDYAANGPDPTNNPSNPTNQQGAWIRVNTCRLFEPSRPCRLSPTNTQACANLVTGDVLFGQSCPSDYLRVDLRIRERQVDCAQDNFCRNEAAVASQLVDCKQFSTTNCPPAVCFVFEGVCESRNDTQICYRLRTKDACNGGQGSGVCQWNEQTQKCNTPLQSALSGGNDFSQPGAFPNCGFDGTCDSVNDVLAQQLGYAGWAFSLIGVVAFVSFIAGGILMITSFGNPEKFKTGMHMLVAAVVGLVIAFSAYLIVNFIFDALKVSDEFRAIR